MQNEKLQVNVSLTLVGVDVGVDFGVDVGVDDGVYMKNQHCNSEVKFKSSSHCTHRTKPLTLVGVDVGVFREEHRSTDKV